MALNQAYIVDNIFDRIIEKGVAAGQIPGKTQEAREWYRNAAKNVSYANVNTMMKSENAYLVDIPKPGQMLLYKYDAKTKDKLPYWDAAPLIFMVDVAPDGWYGLNLHYLHPIMRAKFMNYLYDYTTNKKYDENTRLKLSYNLLKSVSNLKYYQPCFKRYLADHVKSPLMMIPASDWDISIMLPTADFRKRTGNYVYAQSNKMING